MIEARRPGWVVDQVQRELTAEDTKKVADTYQAWRGDPEAGKYWDVPGFCKSATPEEIRQHGYVLRPERDVGAETAPDGEPLKDNVTRLVTTLFDLHGEEVTS